MTLEFHCKTTEWCSFTVFCVRKLTKNVSPQLLADLEDDVDVHGRDVWIAARREVDLRLVIHADRYCRVERLYFNHVCSDCCYNRDRLRLPFN